MWHVRTGPELCTDERIWAPCMYVCRLVYQSTNMLVLGRNQIFIVCCIFQLCCHIQNTVVLNFCWGSGSYMLHMSLCSMREPHPPLTEVLCYSGSNAETVLKYVHSSSIYTWPYHVCTKITKGLASFPGPTIAFSMVKRERAWYLFSRDWRQDRKGGRKGLIVRGRTGPRTVKTAKVQGSLPRVSG